MLPICALLHVHQTLLQVGTEVCEQCCSWLSCYTKITRKVQSSTFFSLYYTCVTCTTLSRFEHAMEDVTRYLRPSWTWDSGTLHCLQSGDAWDVLGESHGTCWTWDFGTLHCFHRLDIPRCPRIAHGTSWIWDSGTLQCFHRLDISGFSRMSHRTSWTGLWDFTVPSHSVGIFWDVPGYPMGHLGPGTLGPYTVSMGWTSQDVPEYPMGHLGHGTLGPYSAFTVGISQDVLRCPKTPWTCIGLWDFTLSPQLGHLGMS